MTIAIASDHAGFDYKEMLKYFLEEQGHCVIDFGTDSDESCDYPDPGLDFARRLCLCLPELTKLGCQAEMCSQVGQLPICECLMVGVEI